MRGDHRKSSQKKEDALREFELKNNICSVIKKGKSSKTQASSRNEEENESKSPTALTAEASILN